MVRLLRSSRTAPLFFLLFLGFVSKLSAQAVPVSASPFAGAPFSLSAADVKSVSAGVPVSKEFSTQILYEEGNYRVAADGTLTYEHRLIYRVDAEDAIKGWSELSAQWDPWFENPAQLHARVLLPSGTFVELDQKTITDAPVKGDDSETFSSEHVRRAPLPGVAVGSIIEETERVEDKIPYFSGGSIYRYSFRWNVPLARSRLTVELPSSMAFKDVIHEDPGITITRTEASGTRRVVYEATNLAARHDSDIELDTGSPTTPMVEFATGLSWSAIAGDYAALADPQTVLAEAQTILPADLPVDRMAKIRAIVKQLHHEIRYTGVEFGAAKLTPQRPSAVIQRHYGDCKDKANLLVAMLRAAGIQANLALLSTGPGRDVDSKLPGINQFDHAHCVCCRAPARMTTRCGSTRPLKYFAVGSLPYDDQGRSALVISSQTTQLTRTPEPRPEDSLLIETRTFKLAGLGPSHVEEVSETHGQIDAAYRGDYGGPETPKLRENLQGYVNRAYLAKTLYLLHARRCTADFDHPFQLTVVADKAGRGITSLIDGVVVIFPAATANNLPKWFTTTPPAIGPDTSADAKRDLDLAQKSRPAGFVIRPYIYEQRVRILVPAGFTVRSLPPAKTTQLGGASLTETYSASEASVVTAVFRFNSGPYKLTADQALAMRTALLELHKRDYVGIFFDQSGAKALTAGHIREALEIDAQPHRVAATRTRCIHLHLARALLDAGIGGEAQVEAKRATGTRPQALRGLHDSGLDAGTQSARRAIRQGLRSGRGHRGLQTRHRT